MAGLAKIVGKRLDPDSVSVKDLKDRFLFTVALEAARCMDEGIVTDPREADVGSILGFGYAPYSGGALSFIDGMGLKAFVARAKELAAKYGPQFEPGEKLVQMAERGETFYGAYARSGRRPEAVNDCSRRALADQDGEVAALVATAGSPRRRCASHLPRRGRRFINLNACKFARGC